MSYISPTSDLPLPRQAARRPRPSPAPSRCLPLAPWSTAALGGLVVGWWKITMVSRWPHGGFMLLKYEKWWFHGIWWGFIWGFDGKKNFVLRIWSAYEQHFMERPANDASMYMYDYMCIWIIICIHLSIYQNSFYLSLVDPISWYRTLCLCYCILCVMNVVFSRSRMI